MQLSQKQKTFCKCFPAFLESRFNYENIQKMDDTHS